MREALAARGHETEFLDLLQMFGESGPLSFDKTLNRISTKAPELFGMMYHAGAMYSATGVTSPVYLANIRHARQLREFILARGYDAVVCSHLFPMETLTFERAASMEKVVQLSMRCESVEEAEAVTAEVTKAFPEVIGNINRNYIDFNLKDANKRDGLRRLLKVTGWQP